MQPPQPQIEHSKMKNHIAAINLVKLNIRLLQQDVSTSLPFGEHLLTSQLGEEAKDLTSALFNTFNYLFRHREIIPANNIEYLRGVADQNALVMMLWHILPNNSSILWAPSFGFNGKANFRVERKWPVAGVCRSSDTLD